MKKTQRRLSIFLVLCMVFSMFTGIPVNAAEGKATVNEGEQVTGLVLKDWLDWSEEGVPSINEEAEFGKETWADLYGSTLYLAYVNPDTKEVTPVTAQDIRITQNDSDAGNAVTYSSRTDNEEFIDFSFQEVGDYTVTYNGTDSDNTVTLHIGYPEIGYYTTNKPSSEGLIRDEFKYQAGEDNTFYMIFHRPAYSKLDLANITYTIDFWDDSYADIVEDVSAEKLKDYITITPPAELSLSDKAADYLEEADYVYEVTINENMTVGFSLDAELQKADVYGNEEDGYNFVEPSYPIGRGLSIQYIKKMEGLVAQWDIDWEQETPVVKEGADLQKDIDSNLYGGTYQFGYVAKEGDNPVVVTADKISVFYDGNPVTEKEVEYGKVEANNDLTEFNFRKTGNYTISYTNENGDTSYVTIHVYYPEFGFYETNEISEDGFLGGDLEYDRTVGRTFYIVPKMEDNWKSLKYTVTVSSEEVTGVKVNGKLIGEAVDIEGPAKVEIAAGTKCNFNLKAVGTITYQDGSVDTEWKPEGAIWCQYSPVFEDSKPSSGFAGCFIVDEAYADNLCWMEGVSGDSQYWVHADTIQDVIDELAKVSEDKGSVTVNNHTYTADISGNIFINVSCDSEYADNGKVMQTIADIYGLNIILMGSEDYELPELCFDTKAEAGGEVKVIGEFKEIGKDAANIYLQNLNADVKLGQFNEEDNLEFTSIDAAIFESSNMVEKNGIKIKLVPAVKEVITEKEDIDETVISDVALDEDASISEKIVIDETVIGEENAASVVEAIKVGKSLDVSLSIGSLDEKAEDAAVKSGIEEIADLAKSDKNVVSGLKYLNIGLKYAIEDAIGTNQITGNLTKTQKEIAISVNLADDYVKKTNPKAKSCKPVVYRYHDGEAQKLESEFDSKTGKLTFKTDRFSVYAIAVEEVVPTGIRITTAPKKTTYTVGEKFDKTGMVVKLVYSDGSTDVITDYAVPTTALAESDKEIAVVYGEYTVKQAVTVKTASKPEQKPVTPSTSEPKLPAKGETITDTATKAEYTVTAVDKTGGTVTYAKSTDTKATSISIPNTITKDGITYNVTAIANNACSGCSKATKLSIGSNVTTIGSKAFYKCSALTSITIPAKVTSIGSSAFNGCKKVTRVTIGKGVKTIGSSAFSGCSKLKTVSMGSNVTTIGDKAFYKCSSLTKITIPSKVTKIGKQAFYSCKKLKTITIKTTRLTSKKVGNNAFKGIFSKATIKVPKSKLSSYKKWLKSKGVSSKAKIKK